MATAATWTRLSPNTPECLAQQRLWMAQQRWRRKTIEPCPGMPTLVRVVYERHWDREELLAEIQQEEKEHR